MKDKYPDYVKYELEKLYSSLPKTEIKDLEDYLVYCRINAQERKVSDMRRSILQFRDILQKPISETDLEDLRTFLAMLNKSNRKQYTRNGIKVHVRKYLKWKFKNWSERFDNFDDIELVKAFNEEKINENTVLKHEDIQEIIDKEPNLTKKTLFMTLYESGARPNEVLTLTWDKVKLNSDGEISELNLFASKTKKARTVYIKDATFYLSKLKNIGNRKGYIFHSPYDNNIPLLKATALRWIQDMGKRVNKHIFPYLLRHSRATELYTNMPSKVAQKFMGHGSDMSNIYEHMNSKDLKESMLKTVYKKEELSHQDENRIDNEIKKLQEEIKSFKEMHNKLKDILKSKGININPLPPIK